MTNEERVLAFLESIAPRSVTNAEIVSGTRIAPHAQVFQITARLKDRGTIKARRQGKEWLFAWSDKVLTDGVRPQIATSAGTKHFVAPSPPATPECPYRSASAFEAAAAVAMGRHFGANLATGRIAGVPKLFDFVSPDMRIVGDAKYYSLVRGIGLPPAKFSVIAEHVWLLEKTQADIQFLVFGNDKRVPMLWLNRYDCLLTTCEFYFLDADGNIEPLRSHRLGRALESGNLGPVFGSPAREQLS